MRNANRQREEQRGNARGEVKVALGPLYQVAVARQKALGYARLSEYVRRVLVDHFAAEESNGAA